MSFFYFVYKALKLFYNRDLKAPRGVLVVMTLVLHKLNYYYLDI